MATQLLPHAALVHARLAALRSRRWLEPDAELEALVPAALDWLCDRADEHSAALAPFVPTDTDPVALVVETERSMHAACERWTAAWTALAAAPDAAARSVHVQALGAAAAYLASAEAALRGPDKVGRRADPVVRLGARIQTAAAEVAERSPRWTALARALDPYPRPSPLVDTPAVHTVALDLAWTLVHGDDATRPSPWAPLLAMWERGAWPMLLPDGVMLVYVPVIRGAEVVPDPARPELRLPPPRRPLPAAQPQTIPRLELIGAGPPPSAPEPSRMGRGRIAVVTPAPARPAVPRSPRPRG